MKEYREQSPHTGSQMNHVIGNGGASYVVTQTEARPTLKQFREQSPQTGSQMNHVISNGGASYVVTQTEARPTLKQFREQSPHTGSQMNDVISQGGASYVVTQTEARPTLKQFREQKISKPNVDWQTHGDATYIDFQGPLQETRRQYIEHKAPNTGAIDCPATQHAHQTGNGEQVFLSHRGLGEHYRPELSKVPQETQDTSVRIMSRSDRDIKKTDGFPHVTLSDLTSFATTSERLIAPRVDHRDNFAHKTQASTNWMNWERETQIMG
jgi:predicted Fe-Mo cluster-binding NifX family protein